MEKSKYIRLGEGGCEMEYDQILERYWRVAGLWGFEAIEREGKLYSHIPNHPSIHNLELIPITKKEWEDGNHGYLPGQDFYEG